MIGTFVTVRTNVSVGDNACRRGVAPSSFSDIAALEFAGILVRVVPVGVECAVHRVDVDGPKYLVLVLVVPCWRVSRAGCSLCDTSKVLLEVASEWWSECQVFFS